jgi:hypothetical protein
MSYNNLKATLKTPEITFDEQKGTIKIIGKCYPEDANEFYLPIFDQIRDFITSSNQPIITVTFAFEYINSSSIKHLLNIFRFFDEYKGSSKIKIIWCADKDDASMYDLGKNYKNMIKNCSFEIEEIEF